MEADEKTEFVHWLYDHGYKILTSSGIHLDVLDAEDLIVAFEDDA